MEISVKRLYREVRYCTTRPKAWSMSNKAANYRIGGWVYPHYTLEKILLALKETKVKSVKYHQTSDGVLEITSEGYGFNYKLKPKGGVR